MLTDTQKRQIETEYEDYALMGEHGRLNGIDYVLEVIGESDFKDYLNIKYR